MQLETGSINKCCFASFTAFTNKKTKQNKTPSWDWEEYETPQDFVKVEEHMNRASLV